MLMDLKSERDKLLKKLRISNIRVEELEEENHKLKMSSPEIKKVKEEMESLKKEMAIIKEEGQSESIRKDKEMEDKKMLVVHFGATGVMNENHLF